MGDAVRRTMPILCAGLQSSGSTWLFNVVAELLNSSADQPSSNTEIQSKVVQFFADSMELFPEFTTLPDYLLIKTHTPSKALQYFARFSGSPVFLTIRDPRDAVASLIRRFDRPFDVALRQVTAAAASLVALCKITEPLTLRFEDRFCDKAEAVALIAASLGRQISNERAREISDSFTREKVAKKIAELELRGKIQGGDDRFDPETHWHPGHVGDAAIGKYSEVLSFEEQAAVILATKEFCRVFDYVVETSDTFAALVDEGKCQYTVGEKIVFRKETDAAKFLGSGWSALEEQYVWAVGESSEINLDLTMIPADAQSFSLRLLLEPYRPHDLAFQRVAVRVNNDLLGEEIIVARTTLELSISADLLMRQAPTVITLIHPDATRPCDHIEGHRDTRMLAINLRSLEISATESAAHI